MRRPQHRWQRQTLLVVVPAGAGVEAGEFGADVVGVGVVEVGEDGQGMLPGVAAGVEVAGGVVGVAEVGEDGGSGESLMDRSSGGAAMGPGWFIRRRRWVVECGEVGADVVGFGDTEVGVKGQCLLPVVAGLVGVAGGVVGYGRGRRGRGPARTDCRS
jgi:hypothetical protein